VPATARAGSAKAAVMQMYTSFFIEELLFRVYRIRSPGAENLALCRRNPSFET
jgi:hypothetical protein